MALIGKIRKNSWLLIVLIGLGLGGFIIMDMTSGQQSLFGGNQFVMGEVEGEQLDWNQFNRTESILYNNAGTDIYARRNALWNYFVEEAILAGEADALGLGVSKQELLDLQFGAMPSPIIMQRFRDPVTQQLDRQQLNEFRTAIQTGQMTDPSLRAFWAHQEKEIIKDRLQSKINGLVSKAIYTPTWMAEMGYADQNQRVDVALVQVPYDEIDNTEVALEDSDFQAFLEENRAIYERDEETRVIEYVAFNVVPTEADSAKWRQQIADLIPEFERTEDDSLFIERNLGVYDPAYVSKERVNPDIADTLFSMPVGSVYGPYLEGRFYKAAKVLDRAVVPDSVRSRHILLPVTNPTEAMQAQSTIDSLKNLIETGQATFDSLAAKYGTDATRTKGGDLGYVAPGRMVKPFNDLIFYQAEEGELNIAYTQFGIHLVEVTGRKFLDQEQSIRVGYVQQAIVPSDETQREVYERAQTFYSNNRTLDQLEAAVDENPALNLEVSAPLARNDFQVGTLPAGQASRDIVRWAFLEGEEGAVSPQVYGIQDPVEFFDSRYIVAGLKEVQPAGLPSVQAVRAQIEPQVINRKKAELLESQMQGMDLTAIASQYNVELDTINGLTFSQATLTGYGNEPKVIGTAFSLAPEEASEPVSGNSGVYVLKMLNKPPAGTATNLPQLRRNMSSSLRSQVGIRLMQAMRENAEIEDNRSRFY